jgi:hypothetical protein
MSDVRIDHRGDFHGVSPEALRRHARAEWDSRFVPTCQCAPKLHGVRFERSGMVCGRCDKPIVLRRTAA